jgi:hypothetical protein
MEASKAMYEKLAAITFADLMSMQKDICKHKFLDYMTFRGATPQDQINS